MKRITAVILLFLILSGCAGNSNSVERPLHFRKTLLDGSGCTFDAVITADYGDKYYEFEMTCKVSDGNELQFCVVKPDSISGISGIVSDQGGALTFDDKTLAFELLADDQITPVIAPWLMIRALTSGYISACGADGDLFRAQIDDSFKDNPMQVDVWFDSADIPVRAEVLWDGKRIMSVIVKNFVIL